MLALGLVVYEMATGAEPADLSHVTIPVRHHHPPPFNPLRPPPCAEMCALAFRQPCAQSVQLVLAVIFHRSAAAQAQLRCAAAAASSQGHVIVTGRSECISTRATFFFKQGPPPEGQWSDQGAPSQGRPWLPALLFRRRCRRGWSAHR